MDQDKIESIVPDESAKSIEQPTETPIVPTIPTQPLIDTAEITKQAAEQARNEILERLTVGKTDAQKEEIKEWLTDIQFLNEKRNPKDWREAVKAIKEESVAATLKALEDRDKQKLADQEQTAKQTAEQEKVFINTWNSQFEQLEKDGKIPVLPAEIKSKLDKGEKLTKQEQTDPAVQARSELYNLGITNQIDDIEKVYYKLVEPMLKGGKRVPVGADAPVSAGKGSAKPATEEAGYSYEEIHNTPIHEIVAGRR